METLIQTIGWVGTFLIVFAYFLLIVSKKVDEDNKYYQAMNLLGAIGVGISVFHYQVWSAVALQIVWGIVAIFALVKKHIGRYGSL